MYSYGWRDYMPDVGRWTGIDQLAEAYSSTSTYAYVANNPISNTDPDGRWINEDGSIRPSTTFDYMPGSYKPMYSFSMSTGMSYNSAGGGGGYTPFGKTQAYADLMDAWRNGAEFSLKTNNGYMSWWTGGAEGDANTSQEMIAHMLKLNKSTFPEIGLPSNYLPAQKGFDWGHVGNTMTAGGIAYYALEKSIYSKYHWVDAKGIIKSTKLLEKGANGKFIRGVQGLRNGYAAAGKATSAYSIAGKVVGGVGMVVTAAQWMRGDITGTEASVDLAMGAIGFTPWGAPISLVYFGGKFLYEYSTGNSLFPKPGEK